jgi:hypothetical protein
MFLERNPSLIDRFHREVANTKGGQYYYFEKNVNMDRLNDYYGEGLKYYMRAKTDTESKLFANSLLVLRYWMADNIALVEKYMKEVNKLFDDSNYSADTMSRFFAARLYHINTRNDSPEKLITDISRYYNNYVQDIKDIPGSSFELVISEALVLTNQKAEGLEWLKKFKNRPYPNNHKDMSVFNILENLLVNNKAGSRNRNYLLSLKKSKRQTAVHSVLNKKYLQLIQLAFKGNKKNKDEWDSLIEATGYKSAVKLKQYKLTNTAKTS